MNKDNIYSKSWEQDGVRATIYNGRLSLEGQPSMRADDGSIIIGIDIPNDILIINNE